MAPMSVRLSEAFRRNVRSRMTELEMSQADLADKLNVTPSFVSQLLTGHRNPGLDSLEEFAKALAIEPSELIREKKLARTA